MTAPTCITGLLEIAGVAHPAADIRQVGFDLSHPYVEQCWGPILGPSVVCLLRRLPVLWRDAEPLVINADELARSLGLGTHRGNRSRFGHALDRVVEARFAEQRGPEAIDVYLQVPPVSRHRLHRLPEPAVRAHHRLLGEHLDALAASS